MFPNFMNDMLIDARCGHCEAPQSVANIRVVGVRPPEELQAFYGEPIFIFIMDCEKCGQWTNYTMRRSRIDAVAGVSSFIDLIEKECQGKKPPVNIPGLGKKAKSTLATSSLNPQKFALDSPLRPSRRENQPNTPPTQQEIQHFLHRLRKTSFKRSSKGFKDWMKGFGVDASRPDDDNNDEKQE